MFYKTTYPSPIGMLTIASDGDTLTGLWMEGQKYFPKNLNKMMDNSDLPIFRETAAWLDAYFAGKESQLCTLPLSPSGSPFQHQVWQILTQIPHGQTMTYGEITKLMGKPMSAQAVGSAVGHNPISIIIPCHRVLGTGSNLTGYAGGIPRKLWLLRHEGVDTSKLILTKY